MAKELPYFKFEPGSWDTGNIQLCSFEVQGVFINLCSLYWQRLGDLPYKLALQKVCGGNATALDSLCEVHAIKVIEGLICIDFLNEQLAGFENTSNTNSKNAREGWEKRRNKQKNATALRPQSDPNAIREEKSIHTYGSGTVSVAIRKTYANEDAKRIFDLRLYFESAGQLPDLESMGWTHFQPFLKENAGKVFNDADHLYNTYRAFCRDYKPPEASKKFDEAEYNKTLWVLPEWEKFYSWRLKNEPDFRNHFGYGKLQESTPVDSNSNGQRRPKGTPSGEG